MASIPAAGPEDDDAWLNDVSPGVRAGQLRALVLVLGIACVIIGGGGSLWGGLLTDSDALAAASFVCSGLSVVAGVAIALRAPQPPARDVETAKPGGKDKTITGDDITGDLLVSRPFLGRLAVAGALVGAVLLAAGAATQGSTEPGGPGPTQLCLGGGLCGPAPTGPATPVPSP